MRPLSFALATALLFNAGCFLRKHASESASPGANPGEKPGKLLVTPENALIGKVVRMNPTGRFVVLNFPVGRLPLLEQTMDVYRQGLKVGEVRVTGPQLDDNIVGDLLRGEAAAGDEVRNP